MLWRSRLIINPVLFYYFMQFMCFYEMQNFDKLSQTLEDFDRFVNVVMKKPHVREYNLLAQCFFMVGDAQSAIKALSKSVQLQPNIEHNSALWILAVYLYRQIQLLD